MRDYTNGHIVVCFFSLKLVSCAAITTRPPVASMNANANANANANRPPCESPLPLSEHELQYVAQQVRAAQFSRTNRLTLRQVAEKARAALAEQRMHAREEHGCISIANPSATHPTQLTNPTPSVAGPSIAGLLGQLLGPSSRSTSHTRCSPATAPATASRLRTPPPNGFRVTNTRENDD